MSKFEEGTICYHKATGSRCVVIKENTDGTIKVRTDKDKERDYYSQELKTESEVDAESVRVSNQLNSNDDIY